MDERAVQGIVDGGVEVRVREHHVGVLAAELQRHLLDGAGGGRRDALAGFQPAGEGDEVDGGVFGERCARLRAGSGHEVGDAVRQAEVLQQLHGQDGGGRGQLGGLEDEGAAGGQRGRDLPRRLEQGVVPRRDQAADAHGLVDDFADDGGVPGVDHAARLLPGEPAEVLEAGGNVVHVDAAFDHPLAGVQRLGAGELFPAFAQSGGDLEQEGAALGCRDRGPDAGVEGRTGCGDGALGVLPAGLGHCGHQFAVGGVADLRAQRRRRPAPMHR